MSARFIYPARAIAIGAALTTSLLAGPAAAADDAAEGGVCEVSGGALDWGVKESFRSYISGTIANGSWETSDGADYETPEFQWSDPTGQVDTQTGSGTISFTGTLHFTGHDGVLDLTLANPTIEFEQDGAAALLLDVRSTDMEGEVAVDTEQEWVGDVAVDTDLAPSQETLKLPDLPTTLTNSGAAAFAGFYEAGAELDPLTVTLDLAGCDGAAAAATSDEPSSAQTQDVAADSEVPWLPITVAGAAALVLAMTVGLLFGGRRSRSTPRQESAKKPPETTP